MWGGGGETADRLASQRAGRSAEPEVASPIRLVRSGMVRSTQGGAPPGALSSKGTSSLFGKPDAAAEGFAIARIARMSEPAHFLLRLPAWGAIYT